MYSKHLLRHLWYLLLDFLHPFQFDQSAKVESLINWRDAPAKGVSKASKSGFFFQEPL